MPEIIYESKCSLCELHLTDLGTLKSLEETVDKEFSSWSVDKKADLVINWFERTWKKEMALAIEKSKRENMSQAQSYKQKNIKSMNKE